MCNDKKEEGFSVIELLIALGLTVLILSAAAMVCFYGQQNWERVAGQAEVQQNLRIAMHTLSTGIRQADVIEIYRQEKKIVLKNDDTIKSYIFDPSTKEIKLGESGSTVAMQMEECNFRYSKGLIEIFLSTPAWKGMEGTDYVFTIYARGKEVYQY